MAVPRFNDLTDSKIRWIRPRLWTYGKNRKAIGILLGRLKKPPAHHHA